MYKSDIKVHSVRSKNSWLGTITEAANWVNTNINPLKIRSITTVLCHGDESGMVTIYYDDSPNDIYYGNSPVLVFETARDTKSWASHQSDVVAKSLQIQQNNSRIIAVNSLEINTKHEECFTVIWSLKQKK